MDEPYSVAIVLTTAFADRLAAVAARMPVWIVDTPENHAAVQQHWASHPDQSPTEGVTTFDFDPTASPEACCSGMLWTVDLHHGEYSHNPPYSAMEIFGAKPTPDLRADLASYGLVEIVERSDGFRAAKAASPIGEAAHGEAPA